MPTVRTAAGKGAVFLAVPGDEKFACDDEGGLRGVASGSAPAPAAALTARAEVEADVGEANGIPRLLVDVAETGLSDVVQGRAGLLVALAGEAPTKGWWLCAWAGPVAGKTPK